MAEYIKREAALEICEKEYKERLRMLDYCGDTVAWNVGNAIKSIPAADVSPIIRGTWDLLRHDKFSDVFQCSECGRKVSLTHGRDVLEQFPYCHCGAKMDGRQ